MPNPKSKPIRKSRARAADERESTSMTTAQIDAWHAAQRAAVQARVEHDQRAAVRESLLDP